MSKDLCEVIILSNVVHKLTSRTVNSNRTDHTLFRYLLLGNNMYSKGSWRQVRIAISNRETPYFSI